MNIAEILKNYPKGTKLYSPICGECQFISLDDDAEYPINVQAEDKHFYCFTETGRYAICGECLLFPSKDNRDWNTIKPKFKDVSDFQTAMNIAVAKAFDAGKKAQKPVEWSEEDEKIRKAIFKSLSKKDARDVLLANGIQVSDALTWLEKQGGQKSLKVYRVENEVEEKGLWRKFDGTWQPLFDMLTDGKCKDMPMEDNPIYREGGKRWFASAPSKEALREWFSKRDLEELVSKDFTISEFEVVGYKKVSDFEYIFTRDNIINRNYLKVSDIYSE